MPIITVNEYKSYTGTTLDAAQTAYVNSLIPVVGNQIETYLDRILDVADYYEWYNYSNNVVLRQYPVNAIKYLGSKDQVATFDDENYTYEIKTDGLYVTDSNITTTTVTFGGAITTLTDIKTAIELAIPAITMTIGTGYTTMSYKLLKVGTGRDVIGAVRRDAQTKLTEDENRTLSLTTYDGFYGWFDYDCEPYLNLFVVYNAGYSEANIPPAIKMVAVNIIKDVLNIQGLGSGTGLSGLYQAENITNFSYQLANGVTWNGSVDIASIFNKYSGDLQPFVKKVV